MAGVDRRGFLAGVVALAANGGALPARADAPSRDLVWTDPARARDLPLRLREPAGGDACAAIVYSHGLGGSRAGGEAWGRAWCDAGFMVLHLQHAGSDIDALRGGAAALRRAIEPQQLIDRVGDVQFVLDELARRRDEPPWSRVRPQFIGMAGHSFGAQTTQALAGQRYRLLAPDLVEPRLRAFMAFSPSPARQGGLTLPQQFGAIDRPMLCITGSLDGDPLGSASVTPAQRAAVYDALPRGQRALLWLDQADHISFAGNIEHARRRAGLTGPRDEATLALEPAHRALVARLSTDWWRAHLLADAAADARLRAPMGLTNADRWRRD